MKNLLALRLPGYGEIQTPENIPSGTNAPENIILASLSLLTIIVVVSSLIFAIYGGVLWTTSGGDKQKLDKARRTITFSIVGLVVMVLAFVIIQTVGLLLGVSYLEGFGKSGGGSTYNPPVNITSPTLCTAGGGFCDPGACTSGNPIGSCGTGIVCCTP